MRKSNICYTALKRRIFFCIIAAIISAIAIALFAYMMSIKPQIFDKSAVSGTPSGISEEKGYTEFKADGVCSAVLCGAPDIENKTVKLFLTNPADNDVCIRAEIYIADIEYGADGKIAGATPGKLLGKSGFIRPGEYVEDIKLKKDLKDDMTYIMIKIATYDIETKSSKGFFYVNTIFYK